MTNLRPTESNQFNVSPSASVPAVPVPVIIVLAIVAFLGFCGFAYVLMSGGSVEVTEATIEQLYRAAEQGNAGAQDEIGRRYFFGDGVPEDKEMMRVPYGKYEPNRRSKDIVKRKVWNDCSAKIVAIHQQACPLKQADEVREVDGVKQGFKFRAGSVTVEILPDQPLPAGVQQNALFTPAAFHLRDLFWAERETLIGKVVDFEFLAGATKGRMGRIFRLREDIVVPGTSLGL